MTLVKLNILNVETGSTTQILRSYERDDRGPPTRFLWLRSNLFVVAMEHVRGAFAFIDLKEGELK